MRLRDVNPIFVLLAVPLPVFVTFVLVSTVLSTFVVIVISAPRTAPILLGLFAALSVLFLSMSAFLGFGFATFLIFVISIFTTLMFVLWVWLPPMRAFFFFRFVFAAFLMV